MQFIEITGENYPQAREIEIAVAPGNTLAERLYQNFGFEFSGEIIHRGNLYMKLQLP